MSKSVLNAAGNEFEHSQEIESERRELDLPRITFDEITRDVRAYLARGEKISAIQWVRSLTGMGWHEAKIFVERVESKQE